MKRFDKPIVTQILPLTEFFEAEEYHQDYAKKKRIQYGLYKKGSGREKFLKEKWEPNCTKPSEKELKDKLTPLQYQVTQKC